ncbi:hypothetical protein EW146_g8044 [Bondarzewia mesenterica]|uniref:DUF7587 domain-containing protein n=1 Tax=Bondarzewia mesenterica TaxID=1095465 RepID=A0A4S4LHR3_9AGAM|nr:hypothetical protein EW146_g8044 [Bondarzewia mesenterica]
MSGPSNQSKESGNFQLGFSALPQYGFGPDLTFNSLVEHNPFLFRVYTPKPLSPFFDSSEPYFIGQKFKNKYRYSVQDFQMISPTTNRPDLSGPMGSGSYADVANHMDGTKKESSPYVTTSFSFAWAIWEASRRYNGSMRHDVEIAVIDARAVAGRAVTALELLRKGSPKERHPDHWKWYRFATEAQDVLVYGYVPGTAVLASIPILSILPKLPSYFLRPNSGDAPADKHDSYGDLSWNLAQQRPSYQQFCQQMSEQFLRSSVDLRLRDTTAGAVRLAMCFLRPWFQKHALKDFQGAVGTVSELAYIMARWPGQWWVREHTEIWDLIQSMVHVIGEEVREAQRMHALSEVTRLQGVVSELQLLTDEYVSVHSRQGSVEESDVELQHLPMAHISPKETTVHSLTSKSSSITTSSSSSAPSKAEAASGANSHSISHDTVSLANALDHYTGGESDSDTGSDVESDSDTESSATESDIESEPDSEWSCSSCSSIASLNTIDTPIITMSNVKSVCGTFEGNDNGDEPTKLTSNTSNDN